MNYKVLDRHLHYQGKILSVFQEMLQFPNGAITSRDIVEQVNSVAILAILDQEVLLVKQYRDGAHKELIEIPAGLIDEGESAHEAARRELLEETGYVANSLTPLVTYFANPGSNRSQTTLFLAQDLSKIADLCLDEHEFVTLMSMPIESFLKTPFEDAKTLLAARYLMQQPTL